MLLMQFSFTFEKTINLFFSLIFQNFIMYKVKHWQIDIKSMYPIGQNKKNFCNLLLKFEYIGLKFEI